MREFEAEVLALNFFSGSRYMGAYLGPQEELATWVKPQVEAWSHGVKVLGKTSRQHPQSAYDGLGMSLQLKWQYLQKTVPGVGTLMGSIEEDLRKTIFSALFRGEEINAGFRKILGHSVKYGGLGIPDPRFSVESAYNTSKADSGELVDSLLGGSALNYLGQRACVSQAIVGDRKDKKHVELVELARLKELSDGQERNCFHKATINEAWLRSIPHCFNGPELSWEEFWDNICLRYGLMPQDIPETCEWL